MHYYELIEMLVFEAGEEWLPKGLAQRGGRQAGKIKRFSKQQKRSRAEAHLLQASAAPIPGDEQPGSIVDEEPVTGEAAGPQDTRVCAQASSSSRGLDQQQPMVTCVAGVRQLCPVEPVI